MKYLWVVSEVIEENRLYKCRQYYVDGSGEIEIGASGDINDSSVRLKTGKYIQYSILKLELVTST